MHSRIRLVVIRSGAVVLLGMILAHVFYRETSCEKDPDFVWQGRSVSPCRFFSETYEEARSKFRMACRRQGAELHTFSVMEDYTMDICVLQNKNGIMPVGGAGVVVVHTSGYHGVEGYAGSAIQVAWLDMFLSNHDAQEEEERNRPSSVILVHAVNPYGMAHYRRTNENNVDLNRNGLHHHPEEWGRAVLGRRDPNVANFKDLESLLNPRRAPTFLDLYVNIWIRAALAIYRHGLPALKRAMVTGQYHNSEGIFYGGQELQPSLVILNDFLEARLLEEVQKNPTRTMIHVHTGLGPSGQSTLLTLQGGGSGSISPKDLADVFHDGSSHIFQQSATEVASGYDLVIGTAEHFFAPLLNKNSDWILTQEFGTRSTVSVGVSLILENMAHFYLPKTQAVEWARWTTKRAFYKRTPKWRQQVLVRGLNVLNQAIARSARA